eukprot:856661-Rhodomonas_salina.1
MNSYESSTSTSSSSTSGWSVSRPISSGPQGVRENPGPTVGGKDNSTLGNTRDYSHVPGYPGRNVITHVSG